MQDISTQALDAYTQHVLSDRTMSPAERARHATVAITSHVMQESRLPMDTDLPVEVGVTEQMERDLEIQADVNMAALMCHSMEVFDWLDDQFSEDGQALPGLIKLAREVSDQKLQDSLTAGVLYIPEGVSFDKENWHPTVVLPEIEEEP